VGHVGRVAFGVLARHRYPSGDRGLRQVGYQCRRELRIAADRVAVFDNDGALWSEKPIPIQLDFTLYRLAEQARSDSTLAGREPYRAVLERDYRWLGEAMVKRTLLNDPGCGCWYCTTTLSASSTTQAVPRTRSPGRETDPGR
jgi:hypothetical protein